MSAQRRVVVTGLGIVSPLGVGVKTVWKNLLASQCGIVSLAEREGYEKLPVRIAAEVPKGTFEEGKFTASEWLDKGNNGEIFPADSDQERTVGVRMVFALDLEWEAWKI
ncbi:hypothetical protein [Parasitella parasitica]|uniref:beta-ketoacyl-[acyl-carrier-protein] synthase I n=1 Tax=Parasitella parasitica TaxID=35722 RepID=A0A0B7NJH6_9FUNG|nr:hypothetical protein [Parasitella parasitica]